jgi:aminoglycoside phosphotransferase (APT) family kinase protein
MTGLTEEEVAGVARFLERERVDLAGPLSVHQISGGRSNLTFRLDDGVSRWVLRMPPRAGRTPSAHDVAREFRVTRALRDTDVPVARTVALCDDEAVIGLPFAVTEFVAGETVQTRDELNRLDDATLATTLDKLIETLVALHRVDYPSIGLETFGRPAGYAERQVRRWTQQWELVAPPGASRVREAAGELARRLAASVPRQQATSIVHGDFRIDNTLLRLDDEVSVAAVVDWEMSTLGDPVADVAVMTVYRHPAFDLVLGYPCAWTSPRVPDAARLAAAYESAGGVPLVDWELHLALAYFKVAVISAGIDHRYRAGATSDPAFASAGTSVPHLLAAGLDVLGVRMDS